MTTAGPWTGRLLGGRYEVRDVIGRGGMADVYLNFTARFLCLLRVYYVLMSLLRVVVFPTTCFLIL